MDIVKAQNIQDFMSISNEQWVDTGLWGYHQNCIQYLIDLAREKALSAKTILVVGAGNCNDIDLDSLLQHFEQVDLLDIDLNALKRATVRFPSQQRKINLIEFDVTFMSQNGFKIPIMRNYMRDLDLNGFKSYMDQCTPKDQNDPLGSGSYDIVIALPLFTQLFSPIFDLNAKELWSREYDELIKSWGPVVAKVCDGLGEQLAEACWNSVSEGGAFIPVTDMFNFYDDPWSKHRIQFSTADKMLSMITNATKDGGVLSGASGLFEWGRNHSKNSIQFVRWLWRYSIMQEYATWGEVFKKSSTPR